MAFIAAEKLGRRGDVSTAPMMRVIAQLWCHEVSRNFGDRIISPDGNYILIKGKYNLANE